LTAFAAEEAYASELRRVDTIVDEAASQSRGAGIAVRTAVRHSVVQAGVLAETGKTHAVMIVMETHRRRASRWLLVGLTG
jgi:hypothetical protein